MALNTQLVKTIKANFADKTTDELRLMIEQRDHSQYSEEAFAAAQEVLEERQAGKAPEPQAPPVVPTSSSHSVGDPRCPDSAENTISARSLALCAALGGMTGFAGWIVLYLHFGGSSLTLEVLQQAACAGAGGFILGPILRVSALPVGWLRVSLRSTDFRGRRRGQT